jgi:hypothetical protein
MFMVSATFQAMPGYITFQTASFEHKDLLRGIFNSYSQIKWAIISIRGMYAILHTGENLIEMIRVAKRPAYSGQPADSADDNIFSLNPASQTIDSHKSWNKQDL